MEKFFLTSEQVSDGHFDKICDFVADCILDAALEQDPASKLRCEVLMKNNTVVIAGEISTKALVHIEQIVRKALFELVFEEDQTSLDPRTANIIILMDGLKVDAEGAGEAKPDEELHAETYATVSGHATNETAEMLPLPWLLAGRLTAELKRTRKAHSFTWLRSEASAQVTVEYERKPDGEIVPLRVEAVVLLAQHDKSISADELQKNLKEHVVDKMIPENLLDAHTKYLINPNGRFENGPRKLTGVSGHLAAGAFLGNFQMSGKDASKVERFGSYAARWAAKSLIAAGFCSRCVVSLTYATGISEPIAIFVDSFGTAKCGLRNEDLSRLLLKNFDFKPTSIIKELGLDKPIFQKICLRNQFMPGEEALWEVPKNLERN